MKHARLVTLLSVVLLLGCRSFVQEGGVAYPPHPKDWPIAVYVADTFPAGLRGQLPEYQLASELPPNAIRLGMGDTRGLSASRMTLALMRLARERGADGIVLTSATLTGTTAVFYRWKP